MGTRMLSIEASPARRSQKWGYSLSTSLAFGTLRVMTMCK